MGRGQNHPAWRGRNRGQPETRPALNRGELWFVAERALQDLCETGRPIGQPRVMLTSGPLASDRATSCDVHLELLCELLDRFVSRHDKATSLMPGQSSCKK
jgi:hypothetical protein